MIGNQYSVARLAGVLVGTLIIDAAHAIDSPSIEEGKKHWSFQPVVRPELPAASQSDWVGNPIDAFVLQRLRTASLKPAKPADPNILLRRIYLDLIGLPPTPTDQVTWQNRFRTEPRSVVVHSLVDQLLASPQYGERWGRHWLDVARYAETDGFEHDAVRPHSWRYRDYVIRSFNAGKPYDRFVREQVAGDELHPGEPAALIATGFNLLGPDMVDSSDQAQRRLLTLNDMTDTTALTFLGLTIGCAKCHDHPFEPLKQRDYYSLQAFYTPVVFNRNQPIHTPAEKASYDRALDRYNHAPAVVALRRFDRDARAGLRKRSAKFARAKSINERDLTRNLTSDEKKQRGALLKEFRKVAKPELSKAQTISYPQDNWKPTHLLHRGDYKQPREKLPPHLPIVIRPSEQPRQSRRELAEWLTDKSNPLPARVMINRIWQHHFGRGLVTTPSDFGKRGMPPTHPQLLDWLASEFMRRDWDIKAMHRLIINSATYQQSADTTKEVVAADPENKLYSRWKPKRLEGEVIRDTLLAIAGDLNFQMGGRSVFPPLPEELFEGSRGWTANKFSGDHQRRSIYIFARRNLRYPFLEVFDAPDSNLSCATRERSITAPQSLTLLNDHAVVHAALRVSDRVECDHRDARSQAQAIYPIILNRSPSRRETQLAEQFLASAPLKEFCRALFNLNDFVYVY